MTEKYIKNTFLHGKDTEIYGFWTLDLRVCAKIAPLAAGAFLPLRSLRAQSFFRRGDADKH